MSIQNYSLSIFIISNDNNKSIRWPSGYHTHLWIRGSRVQTRAGFDGFFSDRKNPEYDFLRKGSKAVGPLLYIYGT